MRHTNQATSQLRLEQQSAQYLNESELPFTMPLTLPVDPALPLAGQPEAKGPFDSGHKTEQGP